MDNETKNETESASVKSWIGSDECEKNIRESISDLYKQGIQDKDDNNYGKPIEVDLSEASPFFKFFQKRGADFVGRGLRPEETKFNHFFVTCKVSDKCLEIIENHLSHLMNLLVDEVPSDKATNFDKDLGHLLLLIKNKVSLARELSSQIMCLMYEDNFIFKNIDKLREIIVDDLNYNMLVDKIHIIENKEVCLRLIVAYHSMMTFLDFIGNNLLYIEELFYCFSPVACYSKVESEAINNQNLIDYVRDKPFPSIMHFD